MLCFAVLHVPVMLRPVVLLVEVVLCDIVLRVEVRMRGIVLLVEVILRGVVLDAHQIIGVHVLCAKLPIRLLVAGLLENGRLRGMLPQVSSGEALAEP